MDGSNRQPLGYTPDAVVAIAWNVILFAAANEFWIKPDSYLFAAVGWSLGLVLYHLIARAIRAAG